MKTRIPEQEPSHTGRVAILIPVFNDWGSLARLLPEIDAALGEEGLEGLVTVVDDGSTIMPDHKFCEMHCRNLSRVEILRLRCNLGHQRAIAVGMAHLSASTTCPGTVVVMDGDGEDRPEDVPRLLAEFWRSQHGCHVFFAARAKRYESPAFQLMYHLYRLVHWLLTGISVRVGNFSVLSSSALPKLLLTPDLWNHYAAAVFRSRIPFSTMPLARGKRYQGTSHMRYSSLVAHGLSAIAVFREIVGARLILLLSGLAGLAMCLVGVVAIVRFFTDLAIPGWATNASGMLLLFTMQSVLSILILTLIVLGDRSHAKVIPLRDAQVFIDSVELLLGKP